MKALAQGNVTPLNAYRRDSAKQAAIREGYMRVAHSSPSQMPVAVCGAAIQPDGNVLAVIREVEPEQVPSLVSALHRLINKLEFHYADALRKASAA